MSQCWGLKDTYFQGLTTQSLCVRWSMSHSIFTLRSRDFFHCSRQASRNGRFCASGKSLCLYFVGVALSAHLGQSGWCSYSPQTTVLLIFLSIVMYHWLLNVLALTIQTRNGLEFAMMLLFLLPSAGIAGVSHHALPNCSHSVSLLSSCGVYNFDAGLVSFCHIFQSVCTYILMAILSLSVHKYWWLYSLPH